MSRVKNALQSEYGDEWSNVAEDFRDRCGEPFAKLFFKYDKEDGSERR